MKTIRVRAFLLASFFWILTPSSAQVYPVAAFEAVTKTLAAGDAGELVAGFRVPSGKSLEFLAGSTLLLNGTLSGTPTGGILDLSAVTLTLPPGTYATTAQANSWFADPSTNGAFSPSAWRTDLSLGALALLNTAGAAQLDADAVTFAKLQNIATDRLLGRDTALTGDPEEITVGGGLEFTGTGGIQRSAFTGAVTAPAGSGATALGSFTLSALNTALSDADVATGGGTATGTNTGDQTITLTGDVTGSGTGSFAATIAANSVALGTDTTGAYVATLADAGSGRITVTGSGVETAAVTLDLANTAVTPGSYGSATQAGTFTVDAQGRLTAASSTTVTPAVGSITGLGTGVGNWLATPSSANLAAALTNETGAQFAVFSDSPAFTGTPTAPTASAGTDTTQIATTSFVRTAVDAATQALDLKASVRAIATSNITLSGAQTIDGVSIVAGDRVLVAGQSTASQNGIYVAAAGAWTRATDADTSADVTSGMFAFVSEGTANGSNGYVLTTPEPIVLGTTALTFSQFSGAGQIIAGTGLSKSGNTLSTSNIPNASLANSAITIAGTSVSLGGSITLDTILGLSSNGLLKRTGANTLAIATAATDYVAPSAYASANGLTMATARLLGRTTASTGAAEEISVGASLSLASGTLQLPDTITAASVGSSTAIPVLTFDAKGRLTAASTAAVIAPAGTLTGTTLAANVVTSSLTTVGALNSGSINSGFGSIDIGTDTLAAGQMTSSAALISTGGLSGNAGDRITLDRPSASTARVVAWGTDNSTTGILNLGVLSANASLGNTSVLSVTSNAVAVTGALDTTGNITITKQTPRINFTGTGSSTDSYIVGSDFVAFGDFGIRNNTDGRNELLITGAGEVKIIGAYNTTTASAANVFVESDGTLKRSTSSLRYKDLLGDYDRGLADALKLRPVYFTDKGGGPRHAGFAAEDVHKAGLTEFVLYEKDDRPDALAYPHMVALTVAALHDVDAQLKSLRARVRALERN